MRFLLVFIVVAFSLGPPGAFAQQHSVIAAEYFFDADPGGGNGTPIPVVAGGMVTLDTDVSTSGLTVGVHVLNVRVQREDGHWGTPSRWNVRVGVGSTMSDAEAFFDTDPGIGNGLPLTISEDGLVNEQAFDVPDLTRGFHTFHVRCFSGGTWSAPEKRTIRLGSALIDGAEAFYDSDPGEGNGISVDIASGADVIAYDSTVSVAAGARGFHNVYLRFRGGGVWSFPAYKTLRIGPDVSDGVNRITGGEFYFDSDPGIGNGCALIAEDGAFGGSDEAMRRFVEADLTIGQHTTGVRVRDAGNRWYGPLLDTLTVIEAHLVATTTMHDSVTPYAVLAWDRYPAALAYHVHYDSLETGAFASFIDVAPPDTSLTLEPAAFKRLFKVMALQVAPEPCGLLNHRLEDQQISQ